MSAVGVDGETVGVSKLRVVFGLTSEDLAVGMPAAGRGFDI